MCTYMLFGPDNSRKLQTYILYAWLRTASVMYKKLGDSKTGVSIVYKGGLLNKNLLNTTFILK